HGQKLTAKQERLIAALLTEQTYARAAQKASISGATLYRWLELDEFQVAYRAARRRLIETTLGRLQQAGGEAVDALRRNLTCGEPGPEIRAALGVLEHSVKGLEILDLVQEIEALKQGMRETKRDNGDAGPTGGTAEREPGRATSDRPDAPEPLARRSGS